MSKDKFVEMVMGRLSSEYALSLRALEPHREAVEAAYETESKVTEDELEALFSGNDAVRTSDLAKKFPKLNEISLEIVGDLDEDPDEDEDDDEDDDDEDEDDDDEDLEDDEDDDE